MTYLRHHVNLFGETFLSPTLADWRVVWFKVLHEMKQEISPDALFGGLGRCGGGTLQWRIARPTCILRSPTLQALPSLGEPLLTALVYDGRLTDWSPLAERAGLRGAGRLAGKTGLLVTDVLAHLDSSSQPFDKTTSNGSSVLLTSSSFPKLQAPILKLPPARGHAM